MPRYAGIRVEVTLSSQAPHRSPSRRRESCDVGRPSGPRLRPHNSRACLGVFACHRLPDGGGEMR
eukprot:14969159-Heterocapsa_arctica.AAC.1